MAESTYITYEDGLMGICLDCETIRSDVPRDAQSYLCDACGRPSVAGMRTASRLGKVDVVPDVDWDDGPRIVLKPYYYFTGRTKRERETMNLNFQSYIRLASNTIAKLSKAELVLLLATLLDHAEQSGGDDECPRCGRTDLDISKYIRED